MTGEPRAEGTAFYRVLKRFVPPLLRVYFRLRAEGTEFVPAAGGCILAANHQSYLDPILLAAACPRPVHYMMSHRFWAMPLIGWGARRAGSFPVDDDGMRPGTLRRALGVLRAGLILGIFPEGGITPDGRLRPAREGTARISIREGVPLVPAGIAGTRRSFPKGRVFPRPCRVTVRFGPPLLPPPSTRDPEELQRRVEALSQQLMARIAELALAPRG